MAYQEFPRCLYLPDGTGRLVNTAEEKKAFLEKGWSESPPPKPACQSEAVSGVAEQSESPVTDQAPEPEPEFTDPHKPEAGPEPSREQPETAPKGQEGDIAASAANVMSQPKPRGNKFWNKKR